MREQRGINATTFKRRASLPPEELAASYHRVGTRAGLHPEDTPYITYGNKPFGRTYITTRTGLPPGYNDEDNGHDEPRTRSTVVVRGRPYTQVETVRVRETDERAASLQRRHLHPLVYVGVSLLFLSLFITAYTSIPELWQRHLDDMTYGYPRTYQTDANVGHGGVHTFSSSTHMARLRW